MIDISGDLIKIDRRIIPPKLGISLPLTASIRDNVDTITEAIKEKFSKSASSVRNEKNNANSKICKIESNKLQQDNNESEDEKVKDNVKDTGKKAKKIGTEEPSGAVS